MAGVKGMHAKLSTSPAYAEKVRARIKAGGIVYLLHEHIVGKREMSTTQVAAALGLLKKVVPDLTQSDLVAKDEHGRQIAIALVAYDNHTAQLSAPALPAPGAEGDRLRH